MTHEVEIQFDSVDTFELNPTVAERLREMITNHKCIDPKQLQRLFIECYSASSDGDTPPYMDASILPMIIDIQEVDDLPEDGSKQTLTVTYGNVVANTREEIIKYQVGSTSADATFGLIVNCPEDRVAELQKKLGLTLLKMAVGGEDE